MLSTPPAFVLSQDQTLRRCLNQAENQELALLMSINPKKPTKRGYYLALTFGTLLSSQGADALVLQPFGPSLEAVSRLYTVLRSSRTSGVRPAVDQAGGPARSRSVQREQYTTRRAPRRGSTEGSALPSRTPAQDLRRPPDSTTRPFSRGPRGDVVHPVALPAPRTTGPGRAGGHCRPGCPDVC